MGQHGGFIWSASPVGVISQHPEAACVSAASKASLSALVLAAGTAPSARRDPAGTHGTSPQAHARPGVGDDGRGVSSPGCPLREIMVAFTRASVRGSPASQIHNVAPIIAEIIHWARYCREILEGKKTNVFN